MSWEDSSNPDEQREEEGGSNATDSMTPSSKRGHMGNHKGRAQITICSPGKDTDGGCIPQPRVSPLGNSRRNKRKQSEPRRVSTSSLTHVVKEEPQDISDHRDDQGRPTTPRLTADTEYRYGAARQRYDQGGVRDLIPATMLSLQGHSSRASDSSEDSLDLTGTSSASLPLHSVMSMFAGGMTSDDAKSDIDDPDGAGSLGTCADSPELMTEGNSRACTSPESDGSPQMSGPAPRSKKASRSYKNLSRSRRIVANARERNRVHTISAAFEGLRRAVPSYSHNQKLSKLAILRIACSYILALASLADMDYSPDHQQVSFGDCVDMCTRTLQSEGRSKRRKVQSE